MLRNRLLGVALMLGTCVAQGCQDRPVATQTPKGSGVQDPGPLPRKVDKLDLLFVVDNSPSMADKQAELARRVPELVASLTDDTPNPETGRPGNVADVHVAVITSSLGSHGTSACTANPHQNEHAHLLPRAGEGSCPSASALAWRYADGKASAAELGTASSCVIASAGEDGCGYEETWEAAYHFLADPKPYASAVVSCTSSDPGGDACGSNKIEVTGVDGAILAERAAFLRQDSMLVVVVLSDENDASLKPAGLNWLPWGYGKGQMKRGWASCANVPDEFEPESGAEFNTLHTMYNCFSCFENESDPNCKKPWATDPLNADVDDRNLRAFGQTQRFGYDFLWGRNRYVSAFTSPQVVASDGTVGPNPIFQGGFRTKEMIVVAAIVGVPKQLVSDDTGKPKTLGEAEWKKIIGPVGDRDPHMIESIAPRAGIPKFAGDRTIDAINGGDRDVEDGDDLQYACIGKRTVASPSPDCAAPDANTKNPLCDKSDQPYFKAYPGLRHLRIVHDLGASGLVASICSDSYSQALAGLARKVKDVLGTQCMHSEVTLLPDGSANCVVFETMKADTFVGVRCEDIAKGLCTPGAEPCRRPKSDFPPVDIETAADALLLDIALDGTTGSLGSERLKAQVDGPNVVVVGSDGKKHVVCESLQLVGQPTTVVPTSTVQACLHDAKFHLDPATAGGWCYTQDPAVLSESCTLGTLRFGGGAQPRPGSELQPLCSYG